MYIKINDVIGEKRINLSYPIYPRKEAAVISMISDNTQYEIKEPLDLKWAMMKSRYQMGLIQ